MISIGKIKIVLLLPPWSETPNLTLCPKMDIWFLRIPAFDPELTIQVIILLPLLYGLRCFSSWLITVTHLKLTYVLFLNLESLEQIYWLVGRFSKKSFHLKKFIRVKIGSSLQYYNVLQFMQKWLLNDTIYICGESGESSLDELILRHVITFWSRKTTHSLPLPTSNSETGK